MATAIRTEYPERVTQGLVDAIEQWWGAALNQSEITRLVDAPAEHWLAFLEYLKDEHYERPEPGTTRAYCGLFSRPDELYDSEVLPLSGARVRALALLVGELAVLDPLVPLLEQMVDSRAGSWEEAPSRRQLLAVLGQVADLGPLERQGALRFFRRPTHNLPSEHLMESFLMVQGIPDDELDWRWMTDPKRLRGSGSATLATLEVINSVAIARQISPNGAVHIGTPLERSIIEGIVEVPDLGSDTRRAMRNFSILPIPLLIPDSSTIAIVRESDSYIEFRQELNRALVALDGIPASDEKWLDTAREIMSDELTPASKTLAREVKRSGFLSSNHRAGRTLGIAGLGSVVGQVVGGNLIAAGTSAAVSAVGTALADFLSARPGVKAKRAVVETYTMFGPLPD